MVAGYRSVISPARMRRPAPPCTGVSRSRARSSWSTKGRPRTGGTWNVTSEVAVDDALVLPGIDQTLAVRRIFEVQPQVPPG